MARWLRWVMPIAVGALGFAVAVAGFAYDLAFAGLPYQDPTPEMQARWRYHSGVASAIELSGVGVLLLGVVGLALVALWSLAAKARRTRRCRFPDVLASSRLMLAAVAVSIPFTADDLSATSQG